MSDRAAVGTTSVVVALVVDAVLVVVFAVVGRSSHAEARQERPGRAPDARDIEALGVGWLAARAWRHPLAVWPTGVIVWAATLVVGMLLRLATGQGTAVAFIVVAMLTLAVLLLGWRAIAWAAIRLRARGRVGAA